MINKKGLVVSGLTTVFLYFGFVLLLIIFLFIFKFTFGETEVKISGHITNADNNYKFLNYLRTAYVLDGQIINMAELINLYQNEKDESKKELYYEKILNVTKEIFNPLEYCYMKSGISDKFVVGYGIFILDEEIYKDKSKLYIYEGSAKKTEKKFRSDNFKDSLIDDGTAIFVVIPTNSNELLYLGFFRSVENIFGIKSRVNYISGCS